MTELDKPTGHLTTVKWRFPSVHPEGRKFTLIAGFLALIGFTALPDMFGWLLAGLTIWVGSWAEISRLRTCTRYSRKLTKSITWIPYSCF